MAASHNFTPEVLAQLRQKYPMPPNPAYIAGRAILDRSVVHVPDVLLDPEYDHDVARSGNWRAVLSVPMVRDGNPVGAISVSQPHPTPFSERQVQLLKTFADQAVIAMENARLFEEVQARNRDLTALGEVGRAVSSTLDLKVVLKTIVDRAVELSGTDGGSISPLAAILGYAELMQEGFYGSQSEKSMDALTRIRSSGKHLLGLINTVLDIAKIESGQFTLNMAEYAIDSVAETVRSATESLAQNKKLTLRAEVAKPLPIGVGDEQRLTQVLLNLVGNAIKFTDTGEVRVTAKTVNGHFAVSVTDTGPGIPPEERSRIFEQFHQVDSSLTKAKGGTGLGLAIAKQIVEMHGGRIWVESTLGKGSTFRMEIPTRAVAR